MALRRTAEFQNDKGIYYKLEIYDSLTGSPSALTLQLGASGFELKYEAEDRTRFSGVIPSSCKFTIVPRDSSEQSVVDDIAAAAYGRFQLKILKSSDGVSFNNYWVGNILSDVSSRQNLSFQAGTQQIITATDGLAELVDVSSKPHFVDGSGVVLTSSQRFLLTIQKILRDSDILNTSQYFDTTDNFLQTQVNWYTGQMPTPAADKDPLHFSGCFADAFQKEENNEFVFINCFEVLDRIMKCWGARLIQSDGMWRVIQPNGYSDTNFERTYRKGNTTVISSSAVQLKTNAGVVLGGGTFDSLHPVQTVQMYYDLLYNLQLCNFSVPLWMTKVGAGPGGNPKDNPPTTDVYGGSSNVNQGTTGIFEQSLGVISAQTGATIEWNLLFRPQLVYYNGGYIVGGVAHTAILNDWNTSKAAAGLGGYAGTLKCNLNLRLKLVGDSGTTYHINMTSGSNGSTHQWTTGANAGLPNIFEGTLSDFENPTSSSYNLQPRSGSTQDIPESGELFLTGFGRFNWVDPNGAYDASTDEIRLSDALMPNQSGSIIKGLALGMDKPDGTNYYVRYLVDNNQTAQQLISASQGTAISNSILELDSVNLGSGPTAQTPTRIITFDAAGNGDDGTAATWQVYQETTGDGETGSITKILCKEILAGRKTGVDVYNGSLQTNTATNYEYHLAFDNISSSRVYVPNDMTYNANEGIWDGQWIETDLDNSGQSYTSDDIAPDTDENATFTTEW